MPSDAGTPGMYSGLGQPLREGAPSAPIFRLATCRLHAAARNLAILAPIAALELGLHYLLFFWHGGGAPAGQHSPVSDSTRFAAFLACELASLVLGPVASNGILGASVAITVASICACRGFLSFLAMWSTALSSQAVLLLLLTEVVAACPATWPVLDRFQGRWGAVVDAVARLLLFLPTDVEVIEELWRRDGRDGEGGIGVEGVNPTSAALGASAAVVEGARTDVGQGYPGNVLLARIASRHARKNAAQKGFCFLQKAFAVLRELVLLPLVLIPFIVDPYLARFVEKSGGASAHKTYFVILHGSGANTGQWLLGRYMLTVQGRADYCLFANYLLGWSHIKADGGVDHLAEKILPQLVEQLVEIAQARREDSGAGADVKVDVVIFGHSLGGDLCAELLHRIYGAPPCATAAAEAFRASARVLSVVSLSGPFRGSRVLTVLKRTLPPPITRRLGFDKMPKLDFTEGSAKSRQLMQYVHEELVGYAAAGHTGSGNFFSWDGDVTLFCGGTDWIVTPDSGLCVVKEGEQSSTQTGSAMSGSLKRFVYVSNVGHYMVVAVGAFWRKLAAVFDEADGRSRQRAPRGPESTASRAPVEGWLFSAHGKD